MNGPDRTKPDGRGRSENDVGRLVRGIRGWRRSGGWRGTQVHLTLRVQLSRLIRLHHLKLIEWPSRNPLSKAGAVSALAATFKQAPRNEVNAS